MKALVKFQCQNCFHLRRDPEMLVRPVNPLKSTEETLEARDEEVKGMTPVVTKRIILIRHGQYNVEAEEDEDKYLTELGRKQAKLTGDFLTTCPVLGCEALISLSKGKWLLELMANIRETSKDQDGQPVPVEFNLYRCNLHIFRSHWP